MTNSQLLDEALQLVLESLPHAHSKRLCPAPARSLQKEGLIAAKPK